ncbi:hypothetical protein I551_3721 [Mycobacterium ulcerans str. Harvey]|uniref:PPE family protein n=1 Tax=Mycobacterium ulcerans str. Harvey TaxID=1299332 RepID=A0ABN0QYH7_MYCUL|nr:hypothetical protein I551_3721 [Mycobacterium ulcerans str. Harvey]
MPDPVKIILQALQGFLNFLRNLAAETLSGPLEKFVVHVLDSFISFASGSVFKFVAYAVLDPMIYFGPFTPAISPLGLPAVTVGLAGLAGISTPPQTAPPLPDVAQSAPPNHQISPATTGVAVAGVSSGATVAGSTPTAHAAAAPSGPSSAGPVAAQSFYAVLGPTAAATLRRQTAKRLPVPPPTPWHRPPDCPATRPEPPPAEPGRHKNAYASTAMNSLTPTDTRPRWTHQQRSQAPSANTARMRLNFPEKSPEQLLDNRIGSPRAGKPDSPKPQRYPCCHAPGPTPTPARH